MKSNKILLFPALLVVAVILVQFSFSAGPLMIKLFDGLAMDASGSDEGAKNAMQEPKPASGIPVLIISSAGNPFSKYYAEILRTEGFNSFTEKEVSFISPGLLASFDVVILGEVPLTAAQVDILASWVQKGGNLIAMRPDKKLAHLLGLTDLGSTMSNAYLLVDTSSDPGMGLVNKTIQYHGVADLYDLKGSETLATLYSDAGAATSNPAVTLRKVGTKGGEAAAFTYDLAKSIIQTRQGNPDWAGQERDGLKPIRSNDMFFGAAKYDPQPDWIDLDKTEIPQADEQQRLLANLVIRMNFDKKPLPRFWYFPRNLKAVVIMTGDDHGPHGGGTAGRFDSYLAMSPEGCSVENWECVRGTSYMFHNTALTRSQALAYDKAGFEMAPHIDTNCSDWTPFVLDYFFNRQMAAWSKKHEGLSMPVTNRNHCIAWSDYVSLPLIELKNGVRLDTSYYYWPSAWVADSPGLFTGSGMPMRFADQNGAMIDVYQAATQMTDESGQSYPYTIDTLLDNALGDKAYYGAFTANMHTDVAAMKDSDLIVESAKSRGIPVITARQMLSWLDARNASRINSLEWSGKVLKFSVTDARSAHGLIAMVPLVDGKTVTKVVKDGKSLDFDVAEIKGIRYARFTAGDGNFKVIY